jgi:predicted amidohydrolase
MVTRYLENRIFCCHGQPDRDGNAEGKSLRFTGKSQITGPDGSILRRRGEASEEIGVVEIDPTLARNKAINPYNDAFGSRRTEYYGELMKQRPR